MSTDLQDKIAEGCPVCGGDGMEYTNDGESPMHTKACSECKRIEQLVTEEKIKTLETHVGWSESEMLAKAKSLKETV